MATRPVLRRRPLLAGLLASGLGPARAETRRFRIAFANLDETPGVTLEGLGFTGADVRRSFELAARTLPVDMVYFDNAGDRARAIANAKAAIDARIDLLIEYNADADANAEIARRLAAARIPALALVDPLPGAPLYGSDNHAAGSIAGRALGDFARENWPDQQVLGVLIGDLADPGPAVTERVQGITDGVHESLPTLQFASLDTGGQSVRADALLTKFLLTQRGQRLLIATLDDLAAVYAKNADRDEPAAERLHHRQPGARPQHPWRRQREEGDSTPTTAAAWCLVRSPTTWTATATTCCRSPCACLPVRHYRRAR